MKSSNSIVSYILKFIGYTVFHLLLFFYFAPTQIFLPYVYVLFILLLPLSVATPYMLFIAFSLGLLVDFFTGTYGVNAFATVLIAYLRLPVLNLFVPKELSEDSAINMTVLGLLPYVYYVFTLCFIHHVALIFLWDFSGSNIFYNLKKVLISAVLTLFVAVIIQLFYKKEPK